MMDSYKSYQLNNLSQFINCIWKEVFFNDTSNRGVRHLIVPDNSVEMLFTQNPFYRTSEKGESAVLRSHLSGLKTKPQYIQTDSSPLLSIRFRPCCLHHFTSVPIRYTINESISLQEIFGKKIAEIEEELYESCSVEKQLEICENFLMKQLSTHYNPDPVFDQIVASMHCSSVKLSELSKTYGISIRGIERKFESKLGLSPAKYQKIIRFVKASNLKSWQFSKNLTNVAYSNNYYDQNHFIKDVRQFTGLKPSVFFAMDRGIQTPIFSE